jgi:hypothetical protein
MIKSFLKNFLNKRKIKRDIRLSKIKLSEIILDHIYNRNGWAIDDLMSMYPADYDDEVVNWTHDQIVALWKKYRGLDLSSPDAEADLLLLAEELKAKGR